MKKQIFFVLFLLCLSAPSFAAQQYDGKKITQKLEPLFAQAKNDQVIKEAEKILPALEQDQRYEKALCYSYIADAWWWKGDKQKSFAALDKIGEVFPESDVYYIVQAELKTRDGKGEEAFAECRKEASTFAPDVRDDINKQCRRIYANSRKTTPQNLWKAFSDNEVAAEDMHKGKLVAVEGKIARIGTSTLGYPEVTFNADSTGVHMVNCQFPKDARADIAKLKKGQKVTVAGICRAFSLGAVVTVDSCWILE